MNHLKNIRISLIILLLGLLAVPIFAQSEIVITAKQNLALQSKPDYDSDVLGVFQRGQEAAAFGRDEAGAWLQINDGWIAAKNVDADSDIMTLPVTTNAVTVKAAASRSLRSGPDGSFDATGNLPSGETALALGRNGDGSWLQVSGGWIPADQVEISGGVMDLPITFSSITIRANINVALHRGPSRNAEVLAILARGEEAIATSRNETGTSVQTPRGWVFVNRSLALEGEIMDLPLAPTVSVTAAQALTLYNGPSQDYFERLAVVKQGEQNIAFGRDETGIWLQIPGGWVSTEQGLELDGDVMRLPITGYAGITITIRFNTTVRTGSSGSSGVVRRLQQGEEAIAFGRNEDGKWLRIEDGWIWAYYVKADGDIMSLPITSGASSTQSIAKTSSRDGVTITSTAGSTIRSEPKSGRNVVGNLQRGEKALAIGRNESGRYLQIESGWVLASYVKVDGDIMDLPIVSEESSTTSTRRATPTPTRSSSSTSAFSEQSIRSQVNRYTDDIRILKISQSGSTTEIEYDLKPWPFVPNEQIAHEVLFKMICALRRGGQIPHKLEFTGQGHFKSDVGRKFKSPSVEIHISANNANRVICSGNTYSDINWRSLASRYKSYPIPSGARVDYG